MKAKGGWRNTNYEGFMKGPLVPTLDISANNHELGPTSYGLG